MMIFQSDQIGYLEWQGQVSCTGRRTAWRVRARMWRRTKCVVKIELFFRSQIIRSHHHRIKHPLSSSFQAKGQLNPTQSSNHHLHLFFFHTSSTHRLLLGQLLLGWWQKDGKNFLENKKIIKRTKGGREDEENTYYWKYILCSVRK